MSKQLKTKVFTCFRCEYEWLQRHAVLRDKNGKKIQKIESKEPQNCSSCKSPSWNIPRP